MSDTIFAPATAPGKAGVAVIRISGPRAYAVVECLAGVVPPFRTATLRVLRTPDGERLDEGLILTFGEGASFTGEAVAELQVHGSRAVVTELLRLIGEMPGLRLAEPGEFARRALLHGRMSLAEIEGLGDLIDAETQEQRRQASRLLAGDLGRLAAGWRQKLVRASALLAAGIDFSDEDLPASIVNDALANLNEVHAALSREIEGSRVAERIRHGFEVAIVGPPNVGKSTLLNYLARRPAAITSEVAGTTRDVIEVRLDLAGLPVTLLDTAGLRDAADPVERLGVELAEARARAADLRVFLTERLFEVPAWAQPDDIVLAGKADLARDRTGVSGLTGLGVDTLTGRINSILGSRAQTAHVATNRRHRQALQQGARSLERAALYLEGDGPEFASEELRLAILSLDRLIGSVDVEDVLDEVFASFCLGK